MISGLNAVELMFDENVLVKNTKGLGLIIS